MNRWGLPSPELKSYIYNGLLAFRMEKGEFIEVRPGDLQHSDEAHLADLMFRPKDVLKFESQPGFAEAMRYRGAPLTAQETRELGQLREEKKKWDASILAAVQAGIHCSEFDGVITTDQLTEFILGIEDLPYTTIHKIWQALPDKYKKKAGRPKKK